MVVRRQKQVLRLVGPPANIHFVRSELCGHMFPHGIHLLVRRSKLRGHHVLNVGTDFPSIDRQHVIAFLPQAADPDRFVCLHPAGRRINLQMDT